MNDPLAVLQRIRQQKPRPVVLAGERCEICMEPISDEHGHLVDLEARNLLCACRGCYILFTSEGAGGGHYRAVPDRYLSLSDFGLSPGQWDAFQIPVGMVFFFFNSSLGQVVAFYPGPAGATESELSLDAWADLVATNPVLETMQPDVEAFLVRAERGPGGGVNGNHEDAGMGPEAYLVPIDACYELVGQLRRLWRGFDGGREAHQAMDAFFIDLRARAR